MKKTLVTVLSFMCGLQLLCASQAHSASGSSPYYKFAPKRQSVEVDLSTLDQFEQFQTTQPPIRLTAPPPTKQTIIVQKVLKPLTLTPPVKPTRVLMPVPAPATASSSAATVTAMPLAAPILKPSAQSSIVIKPTAPAPAAVAQQAVSQPEPTAPAAPPKRLTKPFFTAPDTPSSAAPEKTLVAQKEPVSILPAAHSSPVPTDTAQLTAEMAVIFGKDSSELTPSAEKNLNDMIARLKQMPTMRIQLRAYAQLGDSTAGNARRLSLSRGLMVRSYLAEKGIKPSRIDVRALGSETAQTPADRVDIVYIQ